MKNVSFRNDILPLKNVLYRMALRITLNHEEAEDVVQETLIKVWNKRDDWQNIDNIEAFSLTICRNLALDKTKKMGSDNESLEQANSNATQDHTSDPFVSLMQKDRVRIIRELVDQLPEKQRSCMQLRDFEEKPYKEIAAILNISEEQVKVNIFRARQAIKQRYQEIEDYGL